MPGCVIAVLKSVDEILPTLMYFMLLGSVIMALLSCQMTMTIGSCQVILLVLQPELEILREAERAFQNSAVWIFLK